MPGYVLNVGGTHRAVWAVRLGLSFDSADLELSVADSLSLIILSIPGAVEFLFAWIFPDYSLEDVEDAFYVFFSVSVTRLRQQHECLT